MAPPDRRERRRLEYARTQEIFLKHTAECVRRVLDAGSTVDVANVGSFLSAWRDVFCPTSSPGSGFPASSSSGPPTLDDQEVEVFFPIDASDIKACLPPKSAAAGPDGCSPALFRSVPGITLRVLLNLFLFLGSAPDCLRSAKTIFLAKKPRCSEAGDFRPFSIASVILRLFHRILARRLSAAVPLDYRQRAFLPVDGCAENVVLLAAAIDDAWRTQQLHLESLDLTKAFVTPSAILDAASRKDLSPSFVAYLRDFYNSSTTLSFGSEALLVKPTVGVRQGDPLSPLFNLVLNEMFEAMDAGVCYKAETFTLDAMAFADDLLIFASTPVGLRARLNEFGGFLQPRGLIINPSKSFSLSLVPVPREKVSVCPGAFIIGSGAVLPGDVHFQWRYLRIDSQGRCPPTRDVASLLTRLTRAPLKPQQRLLILRQFLLPRLYHRLVLGLSTLRLLERLDLQIRAAVRRWLSLPHDVPLGYFYAPVGSGGLGIACLRTAIPELQIRRLGRLSSSTSDACRGAARGAFVSTILERARRAAIFQGRNLHKKHLIPRFWAPRLHSSVDGVATRQAADAPAAHAWVREGNRLLTGRAFLEAIKFRINALPVCSTT